MTEVAVPRRRLAEAKLPGQLLSDDRLAQLTSRGDERAFGLLYERHRGALYRYCRSIVHHDEDAQDALQTAFTRAFAALRGGERDLAVRPWLFRIVHNEAVSLLRRRRPADPIDEQDAARGSVEGTVEERERLAALVADLRTLGERQRAALVMRELSGLSMNEIAGALSISPAAAKQALFEARCGLHELAQGRAMECEAVRQTISERDGRVLRGRKLRAHLRSCSDCVRFRALMEARPADLRALVPPLPGAAASVGLLARVLELGGGHVGEAAAGVTGASLGGPAIGALVAKGLAGAVMMTAATGVAAQLAGKHAGGGTAGAPAARPPALRAVPAPAPRTPASSRPHRLARGHGVARRDASALGRADRQPAGRGAGAPPQAFPTLPSSRPTPAPASAPAAQASTTTSIAPPAQAPASPGASPHGPPSVPPGQAKQQAGAPAGHVPPGQAKKGTTAPPGQAPGHVAPGQTKHAQAPPPSAPAPPAATKPAPPGQQKHDGAGPTSDAGDGHTGNPHADGGSAPQPDAHGGPPPDHGRR